MSESVTVGSYLLFAIKQLGIDTVFGIPGDMVIKFFKLIEDDPTVKLCTFSHEMGAGFAAVGASRGTGKPAAAVVTYGPGAFGMFNTVACAYAEKTPLVVVSGAPPLTAREGDFFFHHTVKSCSSQLNAYAQVTQQAVVLDDAATAAAKIDGALAACTQYMLPVYIELPADMVDQKIQPHPQTPAPNPTDEEAANQAAKAVAAQIEKAQNPVVMAGVEVTRFQMWTQLFEFATKLNLPVVSTVLARDIIPAEHENFFGTYLGRAGNPAAGKLVAEADFVLLLGEALSDVNLGAKLAKSKGAGLVQCFSEQVVAADTVLGDVPLQALLAKLSTMSLPKKGTAFPPKAQLPINRTCKLTPAPIVTREIIDAINWLFHEKGALPLLADTGNCLFSSLNIQTPSVTAPSFYGTMGFAVPAAIGYALATKKRPLALVGDGGFQMTGQEICQCPRYGINPIFVVVNNRLWGMEQLFHPDAHFNELANWHYAEMARLWGGKGYRCTTCQELYTALEDTWNQKTFTLIEVVTQRDELSDELMAWIEEQKQGS
jgi:indolepyruvate decarboxylase